VGAEKAILGIVPVVQSAQLLGGMYKKRKKPLSAAMDAFIGIPLIQAESRLIGGF
jgi:hypothetical protein